MSSILKALRKLESDKSAMGEGSVDIGRDILKRSYQVPEERPRGVILIAVGVITVVAGLGAVWIFGLDSPVENRPQAVPQVVESVPVAAPESVVTLALPATDIPLPRLKQPARVSGVGNKQSVAGAESAPSPLKSTASQPGALPAGMVIPELLVEEIVYQADPGARLAVVNDLPVMEGTMIDNVQVVEILPDRVRFSVQGILFEKTRSQTTEAL